MDNIVSNILNSKKKDEEALKAQLEKNLPQLRSNANQITQAVLDTLDPEQHAIGLTFLLSAKSSNPDHTFVVSTERFLANLNPSSIHERCANQFATVVQKYTEALVKSKAYDRGVYFLRLGLERYAPSSEFLTPIHPLFLQLCLLAKNPGAARDILERPIIEIEPKTMGIVPKDYMSYYYYGGKIWILLKEYAKAEDFFTQVVTIPALAISQIMVEAARKLILVQLLLRGKIDPLPRIVSNPVSRVLQKHCQDYATYAQLYEKRGVQFKEIQSAIAAHSTTLVSHGNLGLAELTVERFVRQAIQRLTGTYITLSLQDIANNVGIGSVPEVESILVHMIARGDLKASIDQSNGMVSFQDASVSASSTAASSANEVRLLEREVEAVQRVVTTIERMNENLLTSKDYIHAQIQRDPALKEEIEEERTKKGRMGRLVESTKDLIVRGGHHGH